MMEKKASYCLTVYVNKNILCICPQNSATSSIKRHFLLPLLITGVAKSTKSEIFEIITSDFKQLKLIKQRDD